MFRFWNKRILAMTIILSMTVVFLWASAAPLVAEAAAAPKVGSKSGSMVIGGTKNITLKNLKRGGKVTYKSQKSSIATVSKKGKVTGVKAGSTSVKVTVKQNKRTYNLTYKVTVKKPSIAKSVAITAGKSKALAISNKPAKAAKAKYSWTSTNKSVATVKNGKVTGKKAGSATIKCKVSSGKKFSYNLSTKVTVKAAKTNVATKYTVKFDSKGGSSVALQTVAKGSMAKKPSNPTRTGYTFGGWYSDSALKNVFNFSTKISKNITLYAKWNAVSSGSNTSQPQQTECIVTFVSEGDISIAPQSVAKGDTVKKPEDPEMEGYEFEGWYEDATFTMEYDFTKSVTSDITLYAKWTEIAVTTNTYSRGDWVGLLAEKLEFNTTGSIDDDAYYFGDTKDDENGKNAEIAQAYGILPESDNEGYVDKEQDIPLFESSKLVTREYAAYTIVKALGFVENEEQVVDCSDADMLKYPSVDAIAVEQAIISLQSGKFNPENTLSESDGKMMLKKLDKIVESAELNTETEIEEVTYQDEVIDDKAVDTTNYIVEEADSNYQVKILSNDTTEQLKKGDIFILPQNENNVSDVAMKVANDPEKEGGFVVLECEKPELAEVVSEIKFEGEGLPVIGQFEASEGVVASYEGTEISNGNTSSDNLNATMVKVSDVPMIYSDKPDDAEEIKEQSETILPDSTESDSDETEDAEDTEDAAALYEDEDGGIGFESSDVEEAIEIEQSDEDEDTDVVDAESTGLDSVSESEYNEGEAESFEDSLDELEIEEAEIDEADGSGETVEEESHEIGVEENQEEAVSEIYDEENTIEDIESDALAFDVTAGGTFHPHGTLSLSIDTPIGDGVGKLKGDVSFRVPDVTCKVDAKIGFSGVDFRELTLSQTDELKFKGSVELKDSYKEYVTHADGSKSEVGTSKELGRLPIALGASGLSIDIALIASWSVKGEVSIGYKLLFTHGIQVINNSPRFINDFSHSFEELRFKGSAKAGMGLKVVLNAYKLMDLVGMETTLGPAVDIEFVPHIAENLYCGDGTLYLYWDAKISDSTAFGKFMSKVCHLSLSWTFFDKSTSPLKMNIHIENFEKVEECTYGTGKIEGKVFDSNGNTIEDSKVQIKVYRGPILKTSVGPTAGKYVIDKLPEADYTIKIFATGYAAYETTEHVSRGETVNVESFIMLLRDGETAKGKVYGDIIDAVTGSKLNAVKYTIRKNWNNIEGDAVDTGTADGSFEKEMVPGNYTFQFMADGYVDVGINVAVISGEEKYVNAVLSPELNLPDDGLIRVVLTWGTYPEDLDSHLTGATVNGDDRFHIYYSDEIYYHYNESDDEYINIADLDIDDTDSYGPETVTIHQMTNGMYHYYVHDYTNKYSSDSNKMSLSNAQVRVYKGKTMVKKFVVPTDRTGIYWHVFDMDASGAIQPVNTLSNEYIDE